MPLLFPLIIRIRYRIGRVEGKVHLMRIQFNTGCHYTASGQRIVAIVLENNAVAFIDYDRCIDGMFRNAATANDLRSPDALRRFVMTEYLHNRYEWLRRTVEISAALELRDGEI